MEPTDNAQQPKRHRNTGVTSRKMRPDNESEHSSHKPAPIEIRILRTLRYIAQHLIPKERPVINPEEMSARFTRNIFYATSVYAGISLGMLGAMWDYNSLNREGLESVQRASISFQHFEDARIQDPDHADVHVWKMSAMMENSGATNAMNVVGISLLAQLAAEPTDEQFRGNYSELSTISMPPKTTRDIPVVPDNIPEPFIFGIDMGTTVTPKIASKTKINKQLFIWGWAYYRDVFPWTKPHVTEFCTQISGINFVAERPEPHIVFAYSGCKRHNCEDQQCKDYGDLVRLAEKISASN
jgi:hypothetical protein